MRRDKKQAAPFGQRLSDVFPAVYRFEEGFDFFRPSEKGDGQLQAAFGGFTQNGFDGFVATRQGGGLQVGADAVAVFAQDVKGKAAPEMRNAVQKAQRQGGEEAEKKENEALHGVGAGWFGRDCIVSQNKKSTASPHPDVGRRRKKAV